MATVYDVAAFINEQVGPVIGYRLQKLLYYAQAWFIAWEHRALFDEPLEAWRDGPVCRSIWVYEKMGGRWWERARPDALSESDRATVLSAIQFYNCFSNDQLIALSHREQPWREARRGYGPLDNADSEISKQSMAAYYGAIADAVGAKEFPDALQRGIWLLLNTPEDQVDRLTEIEPVDGDDVLHWLATGENDPWAHKAER